MPLDNHLSAVYWARRREKERQEEVKAGLRPDDNEIMTLPQYVQLCLGMQEDDTLVRLFAQYVSDKCTRIEDRGGEVEYPLRLSRWQWLAEWEGFDRDLEREEQGAIQHGHW